MDIERKLFLQFCNIQQSLINTYNDINSLRGDKSSIQTDSEVTQSFSKNGYNYKNILSPKEIDE